MQAETTTAEAQFNAEIVSGLLAGLAERPGDTGARGDAYARALTFCFMAFQPRDLDELIAARHCLLFHHTLEDAVYGLLHEPETLPRLKQRPQVNAIGRTSLSHQREFQRLRRRKPEEIAAPLPGALTREGSPAATPAACARSDAAAPNPVAATEPGTPRADILATAEMFATRTAAATAPDMTDQQMAEADAIMAALLRDNFPMPPAPPPTSAPLGRTGIAAAGATHERSDITTKPPPPRSAAQTPEPRAEPRPMNRAQRRLAMKQERTQARRAAGFAAKASASGRGARADGTVLRPGLASP
jgi:hypothetical protein